MSKLKIEINIPQLRELNISPNDYIELYCRYHKIEYFPLTEWTHLESKGFLKITNHGIMLRERAIKLFEISDVDGMFNEFYCTFPLKVPGRNGGSRPLRTGIDTDFAKKIKAKYVLLVISKGLHLIAMEALKAEMEMRSKSSSMQFMHAIDAWLNQRDWEKYSYLIEEKRDNGGEEGNIKHGQKLI